jgi:hypothetical protein
VCIEGAIGWWKMLGTASVSLSTHQQIFGGIRCTQSEYPANEVYYSVNNRVK